MPDNPHSLETPSLSGTVPTFKLLDDILAILGSVKTTLFPFFESVGGAQSDGELSYSPVQTWLNPWDEAAVKNLEDEFAPVQHPSGISSYYFAPSLSTNLRGQDDTNLGFPSNAPFSVGAWILPRDMSSVTIMGKYDANAQREWRLGIDGSSKLELEVYDESANADRTGAGDTTLVQSIWKFVVVTTLNTDSDAVMTFYLDGVADGTGNSETGSYVSSPDTSASLVIGANHNTVPAVQFLFDGRIALPFICGKELTAANVLTLYGYGQKLIGLT